MQAKFLGKFHKKQSVFFTAITSIYWKKHIANFRSICYTNVSILAVMMDMVVLSLKTADLKFDRNPVKNMKRR